MELTLIQDTPDYVVCVKPQGVESEHQMPRLLCQQTGRKTVYPVHRLDKETGGVMVYAKHQQAAAFLSRQVQEGTMEKTYLAVVKDCPEEPTGRWDDLLFRDRAKNKSYLVKRERKGVKKAALSYRVLATGAWQQQPVSLVEVCLHTGRTHQIRVQFSGRNLPLVGDGRYGGLPCERLALWAKKLTFSDRDGTPCTFEVLPPRELAWAEFEKHKLK